jgi:hypothetical protein
MGVAVGVAVGVGGTGVAVAVAVGVGGTGVAVAVAVGGTGVAVGGASTVHRYIAGVVSTFPAGSMARTLNVCMPTARPG